MSLPSQPGSWAYSVRKESVVRKQTQDARYFVRMVRWFGVAVVLGLSPFLGHWNVPGFTALLSICPDSLQSIVIPVTAFLMGLTAVAVQWYSETKPTRGQLSKWFKYSALSTVVGVLALLVLHTFLVQRIAIERGKKFHSLIVGSARTEACRCPPGIDNVRCIKRLTLEKAEESACWWPHSALRALRLLFSLAYLCAMIGFAATVGLLVVRGKPKQS